jgi:hypothetical protein
MKIKILFILISLCALYSCADKEPAKTTFVGMYSPYYNYPDSYNGQLKELNVMVHFAEENGDQVIPGKLLSDAEIDSLGLIGHTKTIFDPDGNVISCIFLNSDGTLNYILEIEYKDGIYAGSTYSDSEKIIRRDTCKKFDNGFPVEIEMQNLLNGNRSSMLFNYNSIGQYLSLNQVDSLDNPVITRTYNWDENMRLKEYTLTNRAGRVWKRKANYLPDGNTVEHVMYDGSDSLLWESVSKKVEWDNMGNPIGKVFYRDGKLTYYDIISYIYY